MNFAKQAQQYRSLQMDKVEIKISPVKVPNGAKIIQNYVLGKTVGTGSFGRVHMGMHIQTGEKVAIKIIQKQKLSLRDMERTRREIQILKLVFHPSVVKLYEIIETEKSLLFVTEYLPNGQLFNYIVQKKKLSQQESNIIFQQLVDGLDYIHSIGVAHRDLKPQNILIDYDGKIKIIDFGLSNFYDIGKKLNTECGSPCYAAPEMIEGKHKYDPLLTDIWSLGVVLFAMLCGHLPFCDADTSKLFKKIISGNFKFPSWVSDDAKDLISSMLIVNPNKRYSLHEIKQHPWFKMQQRQKSYGVNLKINKVVPVQTSIVEHMAAIPKIQICFKEILSLVQKNQICKITAMYYLIAKKLTKDNYKIKSYVGSKYFNSSLLRHSESQATIGSPIVCQQIVPQQVQSQKVPVSDAVPTLQYKSIEFKTILQQFMTVEPVHKDIKAMEIFYAFNLNNQKKKSHLKAQTNRQRAETLFHLHQKQKAPIIGIQKEKKKNLLQMIRTINAPQNPLIRQKRNFSVQNNRNSLNFPNAKSLKTKKQLPSIH